MPLQDFPCQQQSGTRDECIIQLVIDHFDSVKPEERQSYIASWAGDVIEYGTVAQKKSFLILVEENPITSSPTEIMVTHRLMLLLSIGKLEEALAEIKFLSSKNVSFIKGYSPQESAVRYLAEHDKIDDAIYIYERTKDFPARKAAGFFDNTVPAPIIMIAKLLLERRDNDARKISENVASGDVFEFKKTDADAYIERFETFTKNPQQEARAFIDKNKSYIDFFERQEEGRVKSVSDLEKIANISAEERNEKLGDFSDSVVKNFNFRNATIPASFYARLLHQRQATSTYKFIYALFWDQCLNRPIDVVGVKINMSQLGCLQLTLTPRAIRNYGHAETFLAPLYAKELGIKIPAGF